MAVFLFEKEFMEVLQEVLADTSLESTSEPVRELKAVQVPRSVVNIPLLSSLCIAVIIKCFKDYPRLNLPSKFADTILAGLPLDIPLPKAIKWFAESEQDINVDVVDNDESGPTTGRVSCSLYWKRLCEYSIPRERCDARKHGNSWRSTFFECIIENFVENNDLSLAESRDKFKSLMKLASPYVKRLNVRNLLPDGLSQLTASESISSALSPVTMGRLKSDVSPVIMSGKSGMAVKWNERFISAKSAIKESGGHSAIGLILENLPFLDSIALSANIRSLELAYRPSIIKFTPGDIQALSDGVAKQKQLNTLNLRGNHLSDADIHVLLRGISACSALESLNLSHNEIGDEGLSQIAVYLMDNPKLKCLNLSNNHFSSLSPSFISSILRSSNLRELALALNPQITTSVPEFFETWARSNNVSLNRLDVSACAIDDATIRRLVMTLLKHHKRINKALLDYKNGVLRPTDAKTESDKLADAAISQMSISSQQSLKQQQALNNKKKSRKNIAIMRSTKHVGQDQHKQASQILNSQLPTGQQLPIPQENEIPYDLIKSIDQYPCGLQWINLSGNKAISEQSARLIRNHRDLAPPYEQTIDMRGTSVPQELLNKKT